MKITVYIRRTKTPGTLAMHTRAEDEPCYDTPRTVSLGLAIREELDRIIRDCGLDQPAKVLPATK